MTHPLLASLLTLELPLLLALSLALQFPLPPLLQIRHVSLEQLLPLSSLNLQACFKLSLGALCNIGRKILSVGTWLIMHSPIGCTSMLMLYVSNSFKPDRCLRACPLCNKLFPQTVGG